MKHICIAGAKSYIGVSLKNYLSQWPDQYEISMLATRGLKPEKSIFEGVDVVFCAAGIAHIRETRENRQLFFDVNRDLVTALAEAAKEAGVKQFILMSSMSVYGLQAGRIEKNTVPHPKTAYGLSKYEADERIAALEDQRFKFCCLRPPMVYGENCTGNYRALRKIALTSPIFPDYANRRSMIYVGNLCEFIKDCVDRERRGLYFPQNAEYVDTSRMVKLIAEEHGHSIRLTKLFNWAIRLLPFGPMEKAFGDLIYEADDTVDKWSFEESVKLSERGEHR